MRNGGIPSSKKRYDKSSHNDMGIDVIDEMGGARINSTMIKPSSIGAVDTYAADEYEDHDDNDNDNDDEDDENGIKEKLAKRYNSLTSLLMKSFRKAKKKKKEQMQRMIGGGSNGVINGGEVASSSNGDIKLIERTNFEDRSEYRHHQQPQPMPRTTTGMKLNSGDNKSLCSSLVSQTHSIYMPRRGSIKSTLSTATAPSAIIPFSHERSANHHFNNHHHDNEDDTQSVPVFIGAKVIISDNP